MSVTSYRTLAADAHGEIEEKHSVFRCRIAPTSDEAAARAVIEAERRTHHDARHHCSAFVLGPDGRIERSNDDGEPAGTAGTPMLDVLRGSGYRDVTAVVTRWFGGTKLGAGGLVRAYGDAVRAALEEARPRERHLVRLHSLAVAHADVGRIENDLRAAGFVVTGTDYAERATLHVAVPPAQQDALTTLVAATTAGEGVLVPGEEEWVDLA
ncbi:MULTISPECIES: IMPACT family protein [Kytococcus]|uniref:DUF1949 domain-containing protein n=1 Tax=Kytococcus schroeteri TaxID=138300 RepID=A0A2I1P8J4_9MICO|nr:MULTISPECIES: YigZ family protein [Kytococcus]OFS11893.1 YigZ family protein [Kytococcus sp. HMSC28H12]PKZ40943.1 DUF1949 domain-containing protein [Kytococcus schroeteri]